MKISKTVFTVLLTALVVFMMLLPFWLPYDVTIIKVNPLSVWKPFWFHWAIFGMFFILGTSMFGIITLFDGIYNIIVNKQIKNDNTRRN